MWFVNNCGINRTVKRESSMIFASRDMLQAVLVCVLILMGGSSCMKLNVIVPKGEIAGPPVNPRDQKPGFEKMTVVRMPVRTAADIALFPDDVDKILKDADDVAKLSVHDRDYGCDLHLTLKDGGVGKFDRPQIIRDRTDLKELNDKFKGIKVVKEIRWCGRNWPNILGCHLNGGIVVVRPPGPTVEGILWLHEIGHLYDLPHRNESSAVMNKIIAPMNTHLNRNECDNLQ